MKIKHKLTVRTKAITEFFVVADIHEPIEAILLGSSQCNDIAVLQINTDKKNTYFKDIDNDVLEFHIAHNEGNYFCTNDQLKEIEDNTQVAINYCDPEGKIEEPFNPNGSIKNIAGIFNKEKNVLGMMPHPERMIDHSLSGEDGSHFFKNLINNLK